MRHDCWLDTAWSLVQAQLPPPPARVVDLGCGARGGFVPALRDEGYDAVGVDPNAPESPGYERTEFESFEPGPPLDALVASTSLHHVADLDVVVDRMAAMLVPAGRLVVLEWSWERFDEPTARWCFERLDPTADEDGRGWLHHHHDRWTESDQPWGTYIASWVDHEGLHRGDQIVRALDARFERTTFAEGPYFFCDLAATTRADEQAAIDAGHIQPTGIRYTGTRR